ncbi:cellulose binding domain-containing protein [Actinoplanes sp. GCM10030250]|uniref:cellulose binding domain-containing protein n=1 Tax=Actinoplanes sp. GCM10030250 TaxID=3273376 RepID=UPI00361C5E95
MSKHSVRQLTPARLILGSAAAILAALVGWVAIRAGGPANADEPVIVHPTAALQAATLPPIDTPPPASAAASPSVSVPVSASASAPGSARTSPRGSSRASATASPSRSSSARPRASASASPTPSRAASPTPVNDLDATYTTTASWRDGFVGAVKIVNNGSVARDFTVTVTYPSGADLRIRGDWNGSAEASGNRVTLRGTALAPGASITAGYQASKDGNDSSRATGCTVGGGTCRVS